MIKRGRGQPTKYVPEIINNILKVLAMGGTEKSAYEFVGINKDTYYLWKREKKEFSDNVDIAKGEAKVGVIEALKKAITRGNIEAIKYWLNNRCPDEWKDMRHIRGELKGEMINRDIKEVIFTIDNRTGKEKEKAIATIRQLANR